MQKVIQAHLCKSGWNMVPFPSLTLHIPSLHRHPTLLFPLSKSPFSNLTLSHLLAFLLPSSFLFELMLPFDPDLEDWAIQNNVYCSFIDSGRRRLLILFELTQKPEFSPLLHFPTNSHSPTNRSAPLNRAKGRSEKPIFSGFKFVLRIYEFSGGCDFHF
jgi:hypothetical protein